ncbi:hypothetical protein [Agrobacterium pusense]|uniref:hypothetical protein n=1 Tax=Agrobacterium pusense TaxID=648995 RepID=UPI00244C3018|nr:hypothetical protein [Agrobacterium pusense]MDH0872128.1 hypothetical protein [Agrobacterium pusense]
MSQFGSDEDSNQRTRDLLKPLARRFTYSEATCEEIVERALRSLVAEAQPISVNSKTLLPLVRRVALDYFGIEQNPNAGSSAGRPAD